MNALGLALDSYLAVRRALGFKLDTNEHLLRNFVEYAQQQHSSIVTTALALDWAIQSNNVASITHANRLIAVRGFARYLHASDPRHEVPPAELIPYRKIRYEPYIYSDEDVTALLGEAQVIPHPLMAATYTTLFGLLAVTGMRLGEALRLDRDDVDCNNAVLFVRDSKFKKSRELPLHSTSRDAIRTYAEQRNEFISRPRAPSFLLSNSVGTRNTRLAAIHSFFRFIALREPAHGALTLSPLLEALFLDRLLRQQQASPNTIASYRDTFRLLLTFAEKHLLKAPSALLLTDIDAPFVASFLDHLETERNNSVGTRNTRLAAIHSFFRFIALREPAHGALIQRVLAIPHKRFDKNLVCFLNRTEIDALLEAPDRNCWIGCRDHALLLTMIQTGLRVSELIQLKCEDISLESVAHVRCRGKRRKQRSTPLTSQTVAVLRNWIKQQRATPAEPLFPSRRGGVLSRDAVERLVKKHAAACAFYLFIRAPRT